MSLFKRKYYCHQCRDICGDVTVYEESGITKINILKFSQELYANVEPKDVKDLIAYYKIDNLIRIYEIDKEFAIFFCPECYESYCSNCWDRMMTFDEIYYDAEYGVCPKGHRRMLFD